MAHAYTSKLISLTPQTVIALPRSGHVASFLAGQGCVHLWLLCQVLRYPPTAEQKAMWTILHKHGLWLEDWQRKMEFLLAIVHLPTVSVHLVLEEKGLDCKLKPSTANTKPDWLMKCYAESSVIVNAWTFSFPNRH
jgi:hypothetical protein